MSEWKLAMMLLAPFLTGRNKLRTWIALMGASVATHFVHTTVGYIAIDAIAAAIIMARPAGLAQRTIGALFVLMLMFDLGFYLSPGADRDLFVACLTAVGWTQWLILAGWIGHDAWRNYRVGPDTAYRVYPGHQRRSR